MQLHVAYLLFSGGGNDIVGEVNMPRFLNIWKDGIDAHAAINWSNALYKNKPLESPLDIGYFDLERQIFWILKSMSHDPE